MGTFCQRLDAVAGRDVSAQRRASSLAPHQLPRGSSTYYQYYYQRRPARQPRPSAWVEADTPEQMLTRGAIHVHEYHCLIREEPVRVLQPSNYRPRRAVAAAAERSVLLTDERKS